MNIEEIWAKIPHIECKGLCQESCGPISASPAERKRLRVKHNFVIPDWEDSMRDVATNTPQMCKALVDGRCRVYESRPTVCRLWGVVDRLRCPHGCEPEGGWISSEAGYALIRAADQLPANQLLP